MSVAAQKQPLSDEIFKNIRDQKNPIVIDSLSLPRYEAALIPAFADAIAENDLAIGVQAEAPPNFKFDTRWQQFLQKQGTRELKDNAALIAGDNSWGPAFGSYENLLQEKDAEQRARKLLWNVISISEANRFVDLNISLDWSSSAQIARNSITLRLVRAYPGTLQVGGGVAVREILEVVQPAWLSSFAMLTLRQYGGNEDYLWIFSPTIHSSRELSSSLRGDNLFGSLIALDDLQLFAAKPESLRVSVSDSFESLVPFLLPNKSAYLVEPAKDSCYEIKLPKSEETNPLSSIYLSPRQVFTLELQQRDPFSLVGRQKLYVDRETMIPFFREVYAQNGSLMKRLLGVFSLLHIDQSDETHAIAHTVVAFGTGTEQSILKTLGGRICAKMPENVPLSYFDPAQLEARGKQKPASR